MGHRTKPPDEAEDSLEQLPWRGRLGQLRYKPEWVTGRIAPRPVLFIYSENDNLVPVREQLSCFAACGEPKKIVKLPGAQHYESYHFCSPAHHEIGMVEAIKWFEKYL